jgi:hypothetical protein
METPERVLVPDTLKTPNDFNTFLVNFFIVDPMLPYEAITWGESQAAIAPVSSCW